MVSAINFRLSSLGSSPGQGHFVVFFGKILCSHSSCFHPGKCTVTSEFNTGGYPCDGLASHPSGHRNTPSDFLLQENRDKC